jgi:S-DNA-T family DNA segregation ATPase FtsK/SpoIIIE
VNLSIALGKSSIDNKDLVLDLGKDHIHTVVFSGMTGSGKSAFHHRVIQQLMRQNSPGEVGFVLIDFKKVEFGAYHGSPYLLQPVLCELEEAAASLRGLLRESSRRFQGKNTPPKRWWFTSKNVTSFTMPPA